MEKDDRAGKIGRVPVARVVTKGPLQTLHLAEHLAKRLDSGDKLLLMGGLGAGKTCFVQGLARGLGVAASRKVTSQTFTLFGIYPGRVPLFHFDAYRVQDPEELLEWGEEVLFGEEGVAVVEWGEGMRRHLPEPILLLRFTILSSHDRLVRFYSRSARFEPVILDLMKKTEPR